MITKNSKTKSELFLQIIVLIALGFSFASCSKSKADILVYPNSTLYEGSDVGTLWERVLPPSGGVMTGYKGKAYTTTASMDEILLYYQRSLSDWTYLGRTNNDERTIEEASWKKNNDRIGLFYLSLPDRPCCFLLVLHTHLRRPLITNPLFYIGLSIILLALLFMILRQYSMTRDHHLK